MKQYFKMCNVFRRPEGFFLFGVLNTPYGGIAVPPSVRQPLDVKASELGASIKGIFDGLPNQITEVDLAQSGKTYDDHLREIGFQKPNLFPKKAALVAVTFDGNSHEVMSHEKNERGAFLPEKPMTFTGELSNERLGEAVLEAFSVSTV